MPRMRKEVEANKVSDFTFHHDGNLEITTSGPVNQYVQRIQFSQFDYVFINGNHYAGQQQIVMSSEKEASIHKRIDQISDIQFFIKLDSEIVPFDCLQEKFPHWKEIPQYNLSDTRKITSHISKMISNSIPPIKGLVLTGGKSIRMGADKSELKYHGISQKSLSKHCFQKKDLKPIFRWLFTKEGQTKFVILFLI